MQNDNSSAQVCDATGDDIKYKCRAQKNWPGIYNEF